MKNNTIAIFLGASILLAATLPSYADQCKRSVLGTGALTAACLTSVKASIAICPAAAGTSVLGDLVLPSTCGATVVAASLSCSVSIWKIIQVIASF